MAEYKAKLLHLRISPRKTRLVADLIRKCSIEEAQYQLQMSTKRASVPILKLLNSAIANARVADSNVNAQNLFIKEIRVDMGRTLRRFRPVSRGRAHPIAKRTSHITIVLEQKQQKTPTQNNNKQI